MFTRLMRRFQGKPTTARLQADALVDGSGVADPDVAIGPLLSRDDLAARFMRHLLDTPENAPAVDGFADDILAKLTDAAERLDVARLPRLPALVPQLLAAMRRDDIDAIGLATLLARDPTLAGEVVRVANSAHYRRGGPITALPQAISAIGNEGLRYAVLSSVMRPIVQSTATMQGAHTGERLAAQSDARTWLCGALAPGTCDPGEAQLASIIASTGLAALLRMMPATLLAQAAADGDFAPRVLQLAATLSSRAAAQWRLDASLQQALGAMCGEAATPLAATLADADALSMLHVLRRTARVASDAVVSTDTGLVQRHARLLDNLAALDVDDAIAA